MKAAVVLVFTSRKTQAERQKSKEYQTVKSGNFQGNIHHLSKGFFPFF